MISSSRSPKEHTNITGTFVEKTEHHEQTITQNGKLITKKPVKTSNNLWMEEDRMKLTKYLGLNYICEHIKTRKM